MEKDIITFTRGVPPAESFPREALITCAERVIQKDGAHILQYGGGAGYHPLCDYIASQHQVSADCVLVGQGSLQLLDHLCRVTLTPGDRVFIEQPTYDRTITLFKRAGADLIGFPLQNGQMDCEAIRTALNNGPVPRFFYVIPDFQNPAGSTMSLEIRQELVRLSDQFDFFIIEDGPYRQLRYTGEPLPSLFDLAPQRVIHMSSYSKLISPGLRTGYMILNNGLAEDVIRFAADTYISPSMFDQAVVLEYLSMDLMKGHIQNLKEMFFPRLKTLLAGLADSFAEYGYWTKPQGGYFVGLFLDKHIPAPDISRAADYGLALSDGAGFFINGDDHFLRLPFCALSESSLAEGVHRLARLLSNA